MNYCTTRFSYVLSSLIIYLLVLTSVFGQENELIDSLKQNLQGLSDDASRISLLKDVAESYAAAVKEDSAVAYIDIAIQLARQKGFDSLLAEAFYIKGLAYDYGGNLDLALNNYEASADLFGEINIPDQVVSSMNAMGVAAYYKGDYQLALDNYLNALEYADSMEVVQGLGGLMNNIGVIYRITSRPLEAIDIYQRALFQYEIEKDSAMIFIEYQNLGVAFTYLDNLDSSLFYLDKAYQIFQNINNQRDLPSLLNAYAEAYYKCGQDYKNARKYVVQAEELGLRYGNQEYLSKIYLLKSQIESDDNIHQTAIASLNKGLAILDSTDRQDLKLDYYYQAANVYERLGQTKQSLFYLKRYADLYKDVQATEKVNAIAEAQTKYESVEKEKEIERLKYEEQISALRFSRQRVLFAVTSVAATILGFLLFGMFKQKKQIQEKNGIISKALHEKELLLKEIHHRVKNNLHFISALLGLQTDHVSDQQALDALQEGQDRVQSMALIHQDLYQREDLTSVNMKDYFVKLMEGLFDSYNIRSESIRLDLNVQELNLDVDSVVPLGLIVNEVISNSLKYAFQGKDNGEIKVILAEHENKLQLTISDDGIGITEEVRASLGESLGYKLIKALTEQLKGTMEIEANKGTQVSFAFEKYQKSDLKHVFVGKTS